MAIDKSTVEYVAMLANIKLSEDDIAHFTPQLDQILEYVNQLKEVDVDNVEPTSHVIPLKNVFRKDEVKQSLDVKRVIECGPSVDEQTNTFKVPKII